jgi:hypothetical protein
MTKSSRLKRINIELTDEELNGLEKLKEIIGKDDITLSNLVRISCRVSHKSRGIKQISDEVCDKIRRGKVSSYK